MRHQESLCQFIWELWLWFGFAWSYRREGHRPVRRNVHSWYQKWDAQTLRDMVIGEA